MIRISLFACFLVCTSCSPAEEFSQAEEVKPDYHQATQSFVQDAHTSGIPKFDDPIWLNSGEIAPESIQSLQDYLDGFGELSELSEPTCGEEFYIQTSGIGTDTFCSLMATYQDGSKLEHKVVWKQDDGIAYAESYDLTVYSSAILSLPGNGSPTEED